jgi:hypothetical protein
MIAEMNSRDSMLARTTLSKASKNARGFESRASGVQLSRFLAWENAGAMPLFGRGAPARCPGLPIRRSSRSGAPLVGPHPDRPVSRA